MPTSCLPPNILVDWLPYFLTPSTARATLRPPFLPGLLNFHGVLAGFQFLGVSFEAGSGSGDGSVTKEQLSLFLLALGFVTSALGSMISYAYHCNP